MNSSKKQSFTKRVVNSATVDKMVLRTLDEKTARGLGHPRSSETLNSTGISSAVGIL